MDSSIAEDIIKAVPTLVSKLAKWFFKYPLNIDYVRQFETKKGYVFVIDIYTEKSRVIRIPKSSFGIKITVDSKLKRRMKEKRVYGEHVEIIESEVILEAYLSDRSYGNVPNYIACHKKPQRLFLLTRVEGPDSENPSGRFQSGKFYQTVIIKLRKRIFSLKYIEIPMRKVPIISGNDKTQIVDSEN